MFAIFETVMSFGALGLVAAPLIIAIVDDIQRDRQWKRDRMSDYN
jgi:hypothetical protein